MTPKLVNRNFTPNFPPPPLHNTHRMREQVMYYAPVHI